MCQEKKEEEDLPALKENTKISLKRAKKDKLQRPETIQTTSWSTEQQLLRKSKEEEK